MGPLALLSPAWTLVKPFWKPAAIALAAGAAWWSFTVWKGHLVADARKAGFAAAEAQYQAKVDAANKITEHDNASMQLFANAVGVLANLRSQAIDLKVTPLQEKIQNEVASDPRYRDCRVSDSVLDAANAARSAVDAGIAASNPK